MEWVGTQVASEKNWEEVELAQSPMHILQVVAEKGVVGPLAPYAAGMLRAATGGRSGKSLFLSLPPGVVDVDAAGRCCCCYEYKRALFHPKGFSPSKDERFTPKKEQ